MIKKRTFLTTIIPGMLFLIASFGAKAQTEENTTSVNLNERYQEVTGFGAALAYYGNWLKAHPNKDEIYEAIFNELSLDILRVRNSFGYDNEMVQRVKEFVNEAEKALGHPIELLSTSWGPPAYLKSNNDRKNGGTIKYTVTENGVEFDYEAFADWWVLSVGQYNAYGVYPTYISIQNEPDWTAGHESCRFEPTETITEEDTIAGYDKALEAVYNKIQELNRAPKLVGPETIGIGYNAVERFVNALNTDYIYAIAHHLYHGIKDESNPWTSTDFSKVGKYKPEIPHFQTEFSRSNVDWFNTAALIYKSFNDEGVTAYLYWDLIWDGGGLVSLDFPWDKDRWDDPQKGYTKTKQFYSFKQFSAFIHPGWQRVDISADNGDLETLAFTNPDSDSISVVLINRNNSEAVSTSLAIEGFNIDTSAVYVTTEEQNCEHTGTLSISNGVSLPARSVTTVQVVISDNTGSQKLMTNERCDIYPNPFKQRASININLAEAATLGMKVFDARGAIVKKMELGRCHAGKNIITMNRNGLNSGIYFYQISSNKKPSFRGRFVVAD